MSARRRRRETARGTDGGSGRERWLVSYADMLTVLVGLFIVLYAISQVDQAKFEQLADSLAQGFGGSSASVLDSGSTILRDNSAIRPTIAEDLREEISTALREDDPTEPIGDAERYRAALAEFHDLRAIAESLEEALAAKGLGGVVGYRIDQRGLVVELVSDELFFVADTARLSPTSEEVIDAMSPRLVGLPNHIAVEGHANTLPPQAYSSNWELSADRAVKVVRRFVDTGGLPGERISAVGFGDSRPLHPNSTEEGQRANRRVDIIVVSGQSERIRELLPQVARDVQEANDRQGEESFRVEGRVTDAAGPSSQP